MMSKTVVALALLEEVAAFQAPVVRARQVQMFSEGDIGVLPPLGVYDPLGLIETRDMARYEVMEIKHGRAAMLGFLHVILIEAGAKFPTADCEAAPTGLIASLESMPTFAWLQIMLTTCMMETGYFLFDYEGYPNVGDKAAGDIGGEGSAATHGKRKAVPMSLQNARPESHTRAMRATSTHVITGR